MAKSEEISFTSAHEIKADRRILKTKKAIYEALVELMQKKKLNSITVTELAAQADINRKHLLHIIQLSMMFLMKGLMNL